MIRNSEVIKNKFSCNKVVANYLQKNGVPLLSVKDNKYFFIENNRLKEVLDNMPFWMKIVNVF